MSSCSAAEEILWLNGVAHVVKDIAEVALVLATLVDRWKHGRDVALKSASLSDVVVKIVAIRVDIRLPRLDIKRTRFKVLQF